MTSPLVVIGLMSGTSMDGMDAAAIEVSFEGQALKTFSVLDTESIGYPELVQASLFELTRQPEQSSLAVLCQLQTEVGRCFGHVARTLMDRLSTQNITVDLIASHGQTIYHIPPQDGQLGSTLQIGHPAVMAAITGKPVVADFRPSDMAYGGHGAPLVPWADRLLFQHETDAVAIQNIGGIANVTALSPKSQQPEKILAFDTGPGNMLIDGLTQIFFQQPFDPNGQIAATGQVSSELLDELLSHSYFGQAPPKSTGREVFGEPMLQALLNDWPNRLSPADMIATVTMLTAVTIAQAYERFVCPVLPIQNIYLAGGGALNPTLVGFLSAMLEELGITTHLLTQQGLQPQYREAVCFALMGAARWWNLPNVLPQATGAAAAVSAGGIWMPATE